jgi:outer membrane protein assembly factor BamB
LWSKLDDRAGYSSPIVFEVGGRQQVVFFTAAQVVGVTPERGEVLWSYPWLTEYDVNAATPLAFHVQSGERDLAYVFISSGYKRGCALLKIERTGDSFEAREVFESNALCCHFASPVLLWPHVYGLDETRDLTCLDLRTGEVAWRRRGFLKGSLLRVGDLLLILGENGLLALARATPEGYRELARARPLTSRPCWSTPVLANGLLYLRDESRVLCLDLRKGG